MAFENPPLTQILFQQPIVEQICANLTFQEANQLRVYLKMSTLPCSFPIYYRGKIIGHLPRVDNETFQIYSLINQYQPSKWLSQAIETNDFSVIQYIVKLLESDPLSSTSFTDAIAKALKNQNLEVAKLLFDHGAVLDYEDSNLLVVYLAEFANENLIKLILQQTKIRNRGVIQQKNFINPGFYQKILERQRILAQDGRRLLDPTTLELLAASVDNSRDYRARSQYAQRGTKIRRELADYIQSLDMKPAGRGRKRVVKTLS